MGFYGKRDSITMSEDMEYQFEDIMELREKQNKEIRKKLDSGLKKFMKELFKKNKDANSVSFEQDWESNDEGGLYCYVSSTVYDKDGGNLDDLSEMITELLNELPYDLREEIGGGFHRNTKAKERYDGGWK